jgi:hypothetical protein
LPQTAGVVIFDRGGDSAMTTMTYDAFLEKEEFITVEEYLKRRERGEINPLKIRIVPPDLNSGMAGGFMVELDTPKYRPVFEEKGSKHAF